MSEYKHYIIIDHLSEYFPYSVDAGKFTSDINLATLRTYKESERMLILIGLYRPATRRKCTIENIRKVKLEMLNKIYERA